MISETKGQDWRAAFYHRMVEGIAELKQERSAQVKRRLYHGHKTYVVKDLTDAQIEEVARLEAARACERAINELAHREAVQADKRARGEAQ